MKIFPVIIFLILSVVFTPSCKNKSSNSSSRNAYENSYNHDYDSDGYDEDGYDEDGYDEDGYDEDGKDEDGHIKSGTYSASVDYYNPTTGYSATYSLDVEVEYGEVTVIYFPNDGYLDDDHIYPSELDDYGWVEIEGEEGKTYEVQLDF